jgi:hypothetical protein
VGGALSEWQNRLNWGYQGGAPSADGKTKALWRIDVSRWTQASARKQQTVPGKRDQRGTSEPQGTPIEWNEDKAKDRRSGRRMSDAIFVTTKVSGSLRIGN